MLQIVILEDNLQLAEHLTKIIRTHIEASGMVAEITVKTDVRNEKELKHIFELGTIFLCDIDLGGSVNGFQIASEIKAVNPNAYIIFVTGHLEFLLQAFRIHAFDFLPKPVTKSALIRCFNDIFADIRLKESQQPAARSTIGIKSGPTIHQLECSRIIMVEKQVNKLKLYSLDGLYTFYETLESFEKRIDSKDFVRIHKGFIINRSHIKSIDNREKIVVLTQQLTCPIGAHFKENILPRDDSLWT